METMPVIDWRAQCKRLAEAAIAYDDAIISCAGDPEKMTSLCTVQGDSLDSLYADWMLLSRNLLTLINKDEANGRIEA